ncbi:MAG: hypothetical protein ABJQ84_04430 [Ekhidna sp.]|uniref:hypothetical protein n=1 Tax=Ekhidna sp. TaxID=2608089 RepID=UPI003299C034
MKNSCVTGKRCFSDEALAVEALIQHHIINDYKGGQGPINVYQCIDCGNWHFTSKGPRNAFFEDDSVIKRIENERRGLSWERKLR